MMKRKRICSLLLALCLMLGLLPAVSPPAEADVTLGFTVQPKSIVVPEGGYALLTWTFDFDPADYARLSQEVSVERIS